VQFNHTALRVDIGENLRPLSALLHQQGMPHLIYEDAGAQVLQVAEPGQVERVRSLYTAWRSGDLNIELRPRAGGPGQSPPGSLRGVPVTLTLILLSVAGFLLVYLRAPFEWLSLLTFSPFIEQGGAISFESANGQYWRMITPAFLHFGWLHIVFNSLWLWELGSRVEKILGHLNMLGLFLMTAVVSNLGQYLFGGPALFGGMSGVVYGLLGFSWVAATLQPRWSFRPSRSIMLLMVGWLVFCMLGIVEGLGFGAVANAAHLGGLLCGVALGAIFGLLSRYNSAI
jgi:GlpG protein